MVIKVILFATLIISSRCRPRLVEGNQSETGEAEYEASDDSAANDYLHEDQESTIDEAQRKNRRHEVAQDFQEQEGLRDVDIAAEQQPIQNKDRYEVYSDINSRPRNERVHREYTNINDEREKGHPGMLQSLNDAGNQAGVNELFSQSKNKRTQSESLQERPINTPSDYGSEMLFKVNSALAAEASNKNNIPEQASDQPNEIEKYYMHSRNRDQTGAKRFENTFDRDRRHVQNNEGSQICDAANTPQNKEEINTDESSENAIIRNIKKLSEQDLEELLNSLPEDKKILLKKIMDKREITKKAGAVDESSYLEGGQSDTSKIEAGYSVESNTESSLSSNTPGASKQTENGDVVTTKNPDSESGSQTPGSKSEISAPDIKGEGSAIREDTERFLEDSINEGNIFSNPNEISKTDNKRETKNNEMPIGDSKSADYESYDRGLKDFPANQEDICSENEAWFESKNEEPKEIDSKSVNFKREISQKDPSVLRDSVKSLEDSFPSYSNNDNSLKSELAPLIRVKRTEKDRIKLRDSPALSDAKVHYSPDNYENEEKSEFDNNGVYDRSSNLVKNKHISSEDTLSDEGEIQRRSVRNSPVAKLRPVIHPVHSDIQKMKVDKLSLGSDTDSVLSGLEVVDDNLMFNSGLRAKRTPKSSNIDFKNSIRIERTAGPMNVGSIPDNSISEYHDNEAFGPLSRNPEENINRHKRVRNINVSSSQEAGSVK